MNSMTKPASRSPQAGPPSASHDMPSRMDTQPSRLVLAIKSARHVVLVARKSVTPSLLVTPGRYSAVGYTRLTRTDDHFDRRHETWHASRDQGTWMMVVVCLEVRYPARTSQQLAKANDSNIPKIE